MCELQCESQNGIKDNSSSSSASKHINANGLNCGKKKTSTITFALIIIMLFSLAVASYHHALGGSFVFDDTVAIVKNRDVNTFPTNLSAIFLEHDFWGAPLNDVDSHKSYRPLTTLLFHLEYAHAQLRASHMKLINLLLHCVNTCLLWRLLSCLTLAADVAQSEKVSTIAAALFAVHPVHTEAVSGIVGRAELLFCLCWLAALLLVATKPKDCDDSLILKDIFILLLAFVGLLCKETAIMILPACVFLDYMRRSLYLTSIPKQLRVLCCCWRNALYFSCWLLLLIGRLWLQHFESPHFKPLDNPIAFSTQLSSRLLSQNFLYALNCWLLLCPQWLSFDWALGCVTLIESAKDVRILSIFVLYTVFALLLWRQRRNFCVLLGFGLLLLPFLPASGIIKVGFVVAERVLYVPSIGSCLLVATSYVHLQQTLQRKWLLSMHKWLLMLVFICFLLRTRQRASDWLTEEKLFASALSVCPKNAKVHYNIARLASDKMERQKSFKHYHLAIALHPQYEAALMNLGNLYREVGDLQTAEKYLQEALLALPDFAAAWMNLGIVQSMRKKYTDAEQSYMNALKHRPRYAVCHYNLGNLHLELNQYSQAMQHWQEAVALNPRQPKAWANILTMLDNRGLYEDALRLSENALKHLPRDTSIMFIRANVHGKLQHYVEAESLYKRVIDIEPLNVLYHTNLGVLYHRWDKLNAAIDSYQRALKLNPQKAKTAHDNLSKLLKRRRQAEKQAKN